MQKTCIFQIIVVIKGEKVIYQTQDGITQLDVRLDGETVWITQDQMAQLFERDRTAIGRPISPCMTPEQIQYVIDAINGFK